MTEQTTSGIRLINGDSYLLLPQLEPGTFDACITDSPYSSGGFTRGDRAQKTSAKYVMSSSGATHPEFDGDNRDQRAFTYWCSVWMTMARQLVKPGGFLMSFIDWRNLPAMSDAIQAAGWIWRGHVPWDKTEASRPQKGWFRTGQCEYIMLASNGPMPQEQLRDGPCLPGIHRCHIGEKFHQTGKPVELMRWLMQILPADSNILEPFAGSGSTLIAALQSGHRATGIEINPDNYTIAADRLRTALL